ncbi:Putative aliphatic sulfonates transport permease protein [Marinibacterium anthonyi]|nr:Putative aliphatic sulfonates transport permease protein [Marinibacterium anthonyi]
MAETMSDAPRATRPGLSPAMRHALIGAARIALGVATVVIVWQAIITLYAVPAFIAPTPGAVVVAFVSHIWDIIPAIAWTLRSVLLGMGIALVLAVILAGIFTLSPLVSRALLPLIIMLRTAPVLAIAPILILIFGRGLATSIAVVVLVSFFPIMVNAAKGFGSTPPNALELMRVAGATWMQTFLKVRLPYALSYLFTGIRLASAGAVLSAMLAEWLSGAPGIGTLILQASSFRDLPLMWAGVVTSVISAVAFFALTTWAERRMAR